MQDPVLHQAMAAWEKTSDDLQVREEYFARRKAVLDEMAAVREAELRLRQESLKLGKQNEKEKLKLRRIFWTWDRKRLFHFKLEKCLDAYNESIEGIFSKVGEWIFKLVSLTRQNISLKRISC